MPESRKRFYALSNRTHDGIYSFNLSIRKYVYTNPAFIRMFGHPCKDIATTDSVTDRIVPTDRAKLKDRMEASLASGADGDEMEYRCVDVEGNLRWMHDRWVILRDEAGVALALEGIVRDITEMKNIMSIKDYLESVLESCMDAIVVTNQKGFVTLANRGAEVLLRMKRSDLVGSFVGSAIRNGAGDGRNMFEVILDYAPTTNYETEIRLRDGSSVPLLVSSALLTDARDRVTGTISYMRDISVRKQAEERIRTLSQQLIRMKEVEMSGIARDLHDHLAQDLYALNIRLSTFLSRLQPLDSQEEHHGMELQDCLHRIMGDARKMVFNIHPTGLDTLGLTNTVNNLCKNVSKIHDLRIDFKAAGMDALDLDFDVNIAIYRIIQEGLNNIVKHAKATLASVRLVYSYPDIIVRIEDDGRGFQTDLPGDGCSKADCMGIWSMRERVALLNGRMAIESGVGKGTSIVVEIPHGARNP